MKNEGNLLISKGGTAVMRSLPGGSRILRFMSLITIQLIQRAAFKCCCKINKPSGHIYHCKQSRSACIIISRRGCTRTCTCETIIITFKTRLALKIKTEERQRAFLEN